MIWIQETIISHFAERKTQENLDDGKIKEKSILWSSTCQISLVSFFRHLTSFLRVFFVKIPFGRSFAWNEKSLEKNYTTREVDLIWENKKFFFMKSYFSYFFQKSFWRLKEKVSIISLQTYFLLKLVMLYSFIFLNQGMWPLLTLYRAG